MIVNPGKMINKSDSTYGGITNHDTCHLAVGDYSESIEDCNISVTITYHY
jgi:hypothetical protein